MVRIKRDNLNIIIKVVSCSDLYSYVNVSAKLNLMLWTVFVYTWKPKCFFAEYDGIALV